MKLLGFLKEFMFRTCALFTGVFLFMVSYNYFTTNTVHMQMSFKTEVAELCWHIMLFSVITAACTVIVDLFRSLNSIVARLIKFSASYLAFALWFFVLSNGARTGLATAKASLMATVYFICVYIGVVAVLALIKFGCKKLGGSLDDSYENVYNGSVPEAKDNNKKG